jgi:hypothetical protein
VKIDEAKRSLASWTERSKTNYVDPEFLAETFALAGDMDEAFSWLQRAVEEPGQEIYAIKVDPRLDRLRSDPRFEALANRVGPNP